MSAQNEKRRSILFPFRSIAGSSSGSGNSKSGTAAPPKFEVMNRRKLTDSSLKLETPTFSTTGTTKQGTTKTIDTAKSGSTINSSSISDKNSVSSNSEPKNHSHLNFQHHIHLPSSSYSSPLALSTSSGNSSSPTKHQVQHTSSSTASFKHVSNAPLTIVGEIPPIPTYHHHMTISPLSSPSLIPQRSGTVMTRKAPPGFASGVSVSQQQEQQPQQQQQHTRPSISPVVSYNNSNSGPKDSMSLPRKDFIVPSSPSSVNQGSINGSGSGPNPKGLASPKSFSEESLTQSESTKERHEEQGMILLQKPFLNKDRSLVENFNIASDGGNSSEVFFDAADQNDDVSLREISNDYQEESTNKGGKLDQAQIGLFDSALGQTEQLDVDPEEHEHFIKPLQYHKKTPSALSDCIPSLNQPQHSKKSSISDELIQDIDNYHLSSNSDVPRSSHQRHKSLSDEILQDIHEFETSLPHHDEVHTDSDTDSDYLLNTLNSQTNPEKFSFPASPSFQNLHDQLIHGNEVENPLPPLVSVDTSQLRDRLGMDDSDDEYNFGDSPIKPLQFSGSAGLNPNRGFFQPNDGRSHSLSTDELIEKQDSGSVSGTDTEEDSQDVSDGDSITGQIHEDYTRSAHYSHQHRAMQPEKDNHYDTDYGNANYLGRGQDIHGSFSNGQDSNSFDFERGNSEQGQQQIGQGSNDYNDFRAEYARERELEQCRNIDRARGLRIVNDGNYSDSDEDAYRRQSVESGILIDQTPGKEHAEFDFTISSTSNDSPHTPIIKETNDYSYSEEDQSEEILSFVAVSSPPLNQSLSNRPSFSKSNSTASDIPQVYSPPSQAKDLNDPLETISAPSTSISQPTMAVTYHGHTRRPPLQLQKGSPVLATQATEGQFETNKQPKTSMQSPPRRKQEQHIPQRSPYVETLRLTAGTANTRVSSSVWGLPIGIIDVNESLRRTATNITAQASYYSRPGVSGGSGSAAGGQGFSNRVTKIDLKHGKIKPRLLASEVDDDDESSIHNSGISVDLERFKTSSSSINNKLTSTMTNLSEMESLKEEDTALVLPLVHSSNVASLSDDRVNRTGTLRVNGNYTNDFGAVFRKGSVIESGSGRYMGRLFIANPDNDNDSD